MNSLGPGYYTISMSDTFRKPCPVPFFHYPANDGGLR